MSDVPGTDDLDELVKAALEDVDPDTDGDRNGDAGEHDDGEVPDGFRAPDVTQRKPWHELSPRTRKRYEAKGHTKEDHEAGRPIPTDKAPKRTRRRRTSSSTSASSGGSSAASSKRTVLTEPLTELFAQVGTMLFLVEPFDGTVIIERSPELAQQLDDIAARNPKVQRALESALTGTSIFGMVGVLASIAIPILINHHVLPRGTVLDLTVPADARRYMREPAAVAANGQQPGRKVTGLFDHVTTPPDDAGEGQS